MPKLKADIVLRAIHVLRHIKSMIFKADLVLRAIHVLRHSKIHDFYYSPLSYFIIFVRPPHHDTSYFINGKVSSLNFMIRRYELATDVYQCIFWSLSLSRMRGVLLCSRVRHTFSYLVILHPPLYLVIFG